MKATISFGGNSLPFADAKIFVDQNIGKRYIFCVAYTSFSQVQHCIVCIQSFYNFEVSSWCLFCHD